MNDPSKNPPPDEQPPSPDATRAYLLDVNYRPPDDLPEGLATVALADPIDVEPSTETPCRYIDDVPAFLRQHGHEYSVFCVDARNRQLLLVQVHEGVDVLDHPFLYQVQREQAQTMLYLPLDTAYQVALGLTDYLTQHAVRIVHLFSTGRCGSTLLCRALGALPETQSMSEPDACTNLVVQPAARDDPDLQAKCCFASTILLAHWAHRRDPTKPGVVLKYRSQVTVLRPLFERSEQYPYPETMTSAFLYRDGRGHSESWMRVQYGGNYWAYRGVSGLPCLETALVRKMQQFMRDLAVRGAAAEEDPQEQPSSSDQKPVEEPPTDTTLHALYLREWLKSMEAAARAIQAHGTQAFGVVMSYETLKKGREDVALRVYRALQLDRDETADDQALREQQQLQALRTVFAKDSQEGSALAGARNAKRRWYRPGGWEERRLVDALGQHHEGGLVTTLDHAFPHQLEAS